LDESTRDKATDLMCEILSTQGAMIRATLAEALSKHGVPVEGQAIHHLVRYAALRGKICLGVEVDGDLTYVVLDKWLRDSNHETLDEKEALSRFARLYLQGYAAATIEDFASWSGLSKGQAQTGFDTIKTECLEVDTPDGSAWMLKQQWKNFQENFSTGHVRILPRYDAYLLGYKNRGFMVENAFAKQIHPGGGLIHSCVIFDGQAIANWQMKRLKNSTKIIVEPFTTIDPKIMPALENEVRDLGRFLNENTVLEIS
jgi:hypothetical protein